ncbi:MAG: DNA replication factor GINS [Natronomonas sp.]|jgi:DNA replication factor GINS
MMDLDELQSVRDRERQTDKLQQLRESFYADAGEFIQQLRRERERVAERTDDPFDSPEVNRLTDEINTAEGTVEAVFERRIGKIVKAASLAAADQPMDAAGMTAEETVLFEDLVDDIVATRHRVFDTLDGETGADTAGGRTDPSPVRSAGPTAGADATTPPADGGGETGADSEAGTGHNQGSESATGAGADGVAAADLMGDGSAAGTEPETGTHTGPEAGPGSEAVRAAAGPTEPDATDDPGDDTPVRKDGGTVARETVRITDDVGEILGVDEREYDLVTDDVVQLPAENVRPLVEHGAAERLE